MVNGYTCETVAAARPGPTLGAMSFIRSLAWGTILLAPLALGATEHRAASLAELRERLAVAAAGDTLVLARGRYEALEPVELDCRGRAGQPIIVRAESVGAVEITGSQGFIVPASAAHVVVEGFVFTHAAGKTLVASGAGHVRFTRNVFQCAGSGPYLEIRGDDVQVDRNEFRDKRSVGNMLSVTGRDGQVAQRLWVHRNHFHDFAPAGANGAETIRFGLSGLSMSMGHGLVEHNLFVRCIGENELISNKSGGNTYRFNTFLESPGAQLTLRHGNECRVYGNYFRGTAGLRIFGDRHLVHSNVLEGNSLGITLGNGGAEVADGAPLTSHDRPDDCVIVFNTLVDNGTHYRMTPRSPVALGARNATFSCNLIVGGGVVANIEGPNPGAVWHGNIVWDTGSLGTMPAAAARRVDPNLRRGSDGFARLGSGSVAIDAGAGKYPEVAVDCEGQARAGAPDVGADEFLPSPGQFRALTPADVGPASP